MKYLKKIFEAWSDPYTLDFQDHGFDLEESGQKLKGKYQGKFVISDLNTWYAELVDRLNDEWEVTQSKHSFNTASGRASFEIEIMDKENVGYFTVLKDGVEVKLYPLSFMNIHISRDSFNITLRCKLENGTKTSFMIYYYDYDYNNELYGVSRPNIIQFQLGSKVRGVDFKKSELENYINIVNQITKWEDGSELLPNYRGYLTRILTEPTSKSLPNILDKKGVWVSTSMSGSGYIINK
jgi:hypothetical protein